MFDFTINASQTVNIASVTVVFYNGSATEISSTTENVGQTLTGGQGYTENISDSGDPRRPSAGRYRELHGHRSGHELTGVEFIASPLPHPEPEPSGQGSGPAARVRRRQRQPDAPHCGRYEHGDVNDEADACAPPVAPVSWPRWAADSGASPANYTRIRKLATHFRNLVAC
jgi:hypothetical protein